MRAVNVFLAVVVSLVLAGIVVEIGLRLLGFGPQAVIQRFDPDLGWSKIPGVKAHRSTKEFDVHFEINELGLRDDSMPSPKKPAGTYRVIMLGDSFVQGFTVERPDLFVDQLEGWWQAEGRKIDVINAGTEGYSTDQEVAWFLKHGQSFEPDLVLLFPYENDLYWNAKTKYQRFDKPRFNADGEQEQRMLVDPGPRPRWERCAVGSFLSNVLSPPPMWSPDGNRRLFMEWGAYFKDPPEFMDEAYARTRGALLALQRHCATLHAELCVIPIPNKASIEDRAREKLEKLVKVDTALWSPDEPVDEFLRLCGELSIPTLDARSALRADAAHGHSLYYATDWHFDPRGNRSFARFVHDSLEHRANFAAGFPAMHSAGLPESADEDEMPHWPFVFAGLWTLASILYTLTYRDEPAWQAILKVGALLALVFTIVIGGKALLEIIPPAYATWITLAFVGTVLGFVLYKLGRRLGTIAELMVCFVGRGHWYLMPLVVVLLSVGSLLVVAASSPLIAPFIYTLF